MVSTSGRPEGDTTLVSGFGCSGVFGWVLAGSWFVFGPWDGLTRLSVLPCAGFWVWGPGGVSAWPVGWLVDLTQEAVVDMIICI